MNDQNHHLRENDPASHQSIVDSQSVAELDIQISFVTYSNLKGNKLLKAEPNYDSPIITARLNEKCYYLGKKGLQQSHPKKAGLPAKEYFF